MPRSSATSVRGLKSSADNVNTVGIRVEFRERGQRGADVWVAAPCLVRGAKSVAAAPPARKMTPFYRHMPRTIQKLWKGEPVHIMVMGSSIDRGSANPRMYLYDEDPGSKTFKQPLADSAFDGQKVGRPELDPYFGWWQHYFGYSGRMKLELMRKFNLGVDDILLKRDGLRRLLRWRGAQWAGRVLLAGQPARGGLQRT